MADKIPEGKVKLSDGKVIDRADACYGLLEHPADKTLLCATDGTLYHREKSGALRRITPKKKERIL